MTANPFTALTAQDWTFNGTRGLPDNADFRVTNMSIVQQSVQLLLWIIREDNYGTYSLEIDNDIGPSATVMFILEPKGEYHYVHYYVNSKIIYHVVYIENCIHLQLDVY